MEATQRYVDLILIAAIALFFSIIAFDNVVDFNANWAFVAHVLSMDTTYRDPSLMWRAITNPSIQKFSYLVIIIWEFLTAICLWFGLIFLATKTKAAATQFHDAKKFAFIGLTMGFLLYMVGFIIIGGEWFSMWQSNVWNGQKTAGLFLTMIMFIMLFLRQRNWD